jgi:predicted nucleic acid-binding protein
VSDYVLDSFALLAFFQNEPGRRRVEALIDSHLGGVDRLSVTVVNLGETLYRLEFRHGRPASRSALMAIDQWGLDIVEVDRELALQASYIKASRRMGYLDAFVVALARRLEATVVTGDPDFHTVEDLVPIDWLQQRA